MRFLGGKNGLAPPTCVDGCGGSVVDVPDAFIDADPASRLVCLRNQEAQMSRSLVPRAVNSMTSSGKGGDLK